MNHVFIVFLWTLYILLIMFVFYFMDFLCYFNYVLYFLLIHYIVYLSHVFFFALEVHFALVYVKHIELPVYEMCSINKLALPCQRKLLLGEVLH